MTTSGFVAEAGGVAQRVALAWVLFMAVISFPTLALAAVPRGFLLPDPPPTGLPTAPLPELIANVIRTALLLVGVIALGYIVYGGFLYITTRGEEQTIHTAKETVTYAVVGIVVIGLAYAIVDFVFCAVGAKGLFCPR